MKPLVCPKCKEDSYPWRSLLTWIFVILLLPIGLALLLIPPQYKCSSCGYYFKPR